MVYINDLIYSSYVTVRAQHTIALMQTVPTSLVKPILPRNSRGPYFPASSAMKSGPYGHILAIEWEQT